METTLVQTTNAEDIKNQFNQVLASGGYAIGSQPAIKGQVGDKPTVTNLGEYEVRQGTASDGKKWVNARVLTSHGYMDVDIQFLNSAHTNKGAEFVTLIESNNYVNKKGKSVSGKKLTYIG
jgi:hypothetical protein